MWAIFTSCKHIFLSNRNLFKWRNRGVSWHMYVFIFSLLTLSCMVQGASLHSDGEWWKGMRKKLGGFMAEASLVSHLPSLSPLHIPTWVFKFWSTVTIIYSFPVPFQMVFLVCLFSQGWKCLMMEPGFSCAVTTLTWWASRV